MNRLLLLAILLFMMSCEVQAQATAPDTQSSWKETRAKAERRLSKGRLFRNVGFGIAGAGVGIAVYGLFADTVVPQSFCQPQLAPCAPLPPPRREVGIPVLVGGLGTAIGGSIFASSGLARIHRAQEELKALDDLGKRKGWTISLYPASFRPGGVLVSYHW